MAKEKTATTGTFMQEMFHVGLYKRSQGKMTRQMTCAVIWLAFALGAWRLHDTMLTVRARWLVDRLPSAAAEWVPFALRFGLPFLLLAAGGWVGFRVVSYPRFADFLIAVEAEINKVSWPSRAELVRSSLVVIFVIFALAGVLFAYDVIWQFLFQWLGVRQ